jgi:hypothetical protein
MLLEPSEIGIIIHIIQYPKISELIKHSIILDYIKVNMEYSFITLTLTLIIWSPEAFYILINLKIL